MAARHAELFTVADTTDLEALLDVLTAQEVESVTIQIPDGAMTLYNARDFRRVIEAARAANIDLAVTTDDPMRRELARIMGINIVSRPRTIASEDEVLASAPLSSVAEAGPMPTSEDRLRSEQTTAQRTVLADTSPLGEHDAETRQAPLLETAQSNEVLAQAPHLDEDELSEASFSFVITPPVPRRPELAAQHTHQATSDALPEFELWDRRQHTAHDARPRRASRPRAPRIFPILAVAATVVILAALLAAILAPAATIAITPQVRDISATLTYGVNLPGTHYDVAMPPETLSTTLTYSASIPTTGQRTEPDGTATGSILLTNPLTRAITIAAGTTVTSDDGTDFVVTEDTLVPAADPYGTLTFGSATASIRASVAGPVGNVDAESISGQMDNAVFYTNRDATGGGSNKVIRTVSQDDIDTLQQQAQTALNGKVEGAIASLITAGQQLIPDSRSTAPMQANFSRTLGQDATDLSINAQMQVSALAYQPDALAQQAHAAATQKLTSMTGANDQLLANTVAVSNPTEVAGTNGTAFTITATGQVQARIDQHTLSALKSDIAGQDVEESLARVQQVPGVGTASIERSNAWLTRGMPRLSSRITIEVYGAQGVSTQTTSTRP